MELRIRPASQADLSAIHALLALAALPCDDLATSHIEFLVAATGQQIVGVVGVQVMPPAGLLRSLAVAPNVRGTGLGKRLIYALEQHAALRGVTQLTLLTETAAPFFSHLGYAVIERGHVADAIAATSEFRSLCPASATCMHKHFVLD
ncbi:arsenic resistance N-acetyltransferase ArsN2 [Stenotrophomonas sp. Iso1]|uniref:arsenic resistance N-acetyltransferase ArsN2 n=1 Tax=Stenotrophomonas sp. Iso1 TaxID=2977283 RepID=UPI0022B7C14C|nr:arsenic resistance N-acetyltransferase ArsN2 [Stenotrophomonas sp. Iso1]